ncbi:hypothetical protein TWF281_005157 [Arthrobotrys megalospora]
MPQSRRPPPSTASSKGKQSKPDKQKNTSTGQRTGIKRKDKNAAKSTNPLVLSQFKAILSTFQHTFSHLFTPELPALIQAVKQSLYLRDYVAAFDSPEKLQAYVVRWSVARALAYFEMISGAWWSEEVTQMFSRRGHGTLNVTCIGGGAGAEVVGIAAAYSSLNSPVEDKDKGEGEEEDAVLQDTSLGGGLDLTLLDFATWAPITDSLYTTITDSSRQSKVFLDKTKLSAKCHQQDVLTPLSETTISSMASADIVTILFTAGELYSQSPTATTRFFMSLHALTKPGALLVIVDSAGGFEDLDVLKKGNSSVETQQSSSIGGYKLGFLLDKTLTNREQWQTIASQDAKWWRVPQELKDSGAYPLELENMRCLIRVYRRNDE